MRSKLVIVVARVRMPVTLAAMAVIVVNIVVGFFGRLPVWAPACRSGSTVSSRTATSATACRQPGRSRPEPGRSRPEPRRQGRSWPRAAAAAPALRGNASEAPGPR